MLTLFSSTTWCWAARGSVCVLLLLVVLLLTQNRFQSVSCFMKRLKVQLCIFHPQHVANTLCSDGKIQTNVFMSLNRFVCFCRNSVNYRSLHQLCDRRGATHRSQSETLDQTGSRPHMCPGLLNTGTIPPVFMLYLCFTAHNDDDCCLLLQNQTQTLPLCTLCHNK